MKSLNYNEGKPKYGLVLKDTPKAMLEEALLAMAGCVKYSRDNWKLSMGTDHAEEFMDDNMESMLRHIIAYLSGEKTDPETGRHHMACVRRRAAFAIEYDMQEKIVTMEAQHDAPLGNPQWRVRLPNLARRDEMPEWLLDLIEARCDEGYEGEEEVFVQYMFTWSETPEGEVFWGDVDKWQLGCGELPKRPTRFDWSITPEWAQWAAIDYDGTGYWYSAKPSHRNNGQWHGVNLEIGIIGNHMLRDGEDWTTTLEERPR